MHTEQNILIHICAFRVVPFECIFIWQMKALKEHVLQDGNQTIFEEIRADKS